MKDDEETVILNDGKYRAKVDKYNYILYEISKYRTGEHKGEEREVVMGYYTSLRHLVVAISEDMLKRKLKSNKHKDYEGVFDCMTKHIAAVERKFKVELTGGNKK